MDEVDFTILAATSVLGDLVEKCPPAAACRDAFERMSRATVQMCLGGGSRAPASAASPSSTYTNAPTRQTVQKGEQTIKTEDNKISGHQYSAAYHAAKSSQTIVHLSPTQQHMMQPNSVCHSHSIDSYSQHAQMSAEARRRQPVHFDDGFQELFTSPRHPQNTPSTYGPVQRQNSYVQSPTTPTEGPQYHPSVYTQTHHQRAYPQSHGDSMMIDPALQQRTNLNSPYTPATPGDWGHIDMSQYGIPDAEMWEHDSWSEEGNPGQVDLFDGFFFGGGN